MSRSLKCWNIIALLLTSSTRMRQGESSRSGKPDFLGSFLLFCDNLYPINSVGTWGRHNCQDIVKDTNVWEMVAFKEWKAAFKSCLSVDYSDWTERKLELFLRTRVVTRFSRNLEHRDGNMIAKVIIRHRRVFASREAPLCVCRPVLERNPLFTMWTKRNDGNILGLTDKRICLSCCLQGLCWPSLQRAQLGLNLWRLASLNPLLLHLHHCQRHFLDYRGRILFRLVLQK